MTMPLSFFVAGIMQGSRVETSIHGQEYRERISGLIARHFPEAEIFDPFAHHPRSLEYDFDEGRDTFFELMERAGQTDVLIAFLPEASMGTAIELWSAFHTGAVVVCVSPLTENWVVKFLADRIVADCDELEALFESGEFEAIIKAKIDFR